MEAVDKVREYIVNGDIYQANISRRFSVDIKGDPYPLFTEIFRRNPAPFHPREHHTFLRSSKLPVILAFCISMHERAAISNKATLVLQINS